MGTRWKKPLLALIISLLVDGLGQIYNGELIKGMALALAGWILIWVGFSYLMSSFGGLIVFIVAGLAFKIYLCVDSFAVAKRIQADIAHSKPSLALRIGVAILIIVVVSCVSSDWFINKFFAFHAFKIPSASMCPTICEGDRMVANVKAFRGTSPQRGDVVMFRFGPDRISFIKRVIGVAGDVVSESNGQLLVNARPIATPPSGCGKAAAQDTYQPARIGSVQVKAGTVFLVGDNINNSYDSRHFGLIGESQVFGRPVYLYWSPERSRIGCPVH